MPLYSTVEPILHVKELINVLLAPPVVPLFFNIPLTVIFLGLFPPAPVIDVQITKELVPIINCPSTVLDAFIEIAPVKVKVPAPVIVAPKPVVVERELALQLGFKDKLFPLIIEIAPVTVRRLDPVIVDVPAFAVVIDANVFVTSMFSVPPALIVMELLTSIVLAAIVLPVMIIVCALTLNAINPKAKNKKTFLK